VLVHEAEHARRRDPLRRLAGRAAADVLVWLPLVGWWTSRRLEEAELAADRAAIDRVGRTPLAQALRATATAAAPAVVGARFDGAGAAGCGSCSARSCHPGGRRWWRACCRCWA
jgi:beta-lactamase regulating signal transducer with metallopeptidase domain